MRYCRIILSALLAVCLLMPFAACEETPSDEAVFYTVKFETGGGSILQDMKLQEGALIPIPETPTKEGCIFDGWRTSDGISWIFSRDTVKSDITLVAQWERVGTLFEWEVKNGEIVITNYRGKLASVVIPDIIDGLPVTAIAQRAFAGELSDNLKRITLGESITSVGASAFEDCTDIEINVKGKLEYVGEKAFLNCNMLREVSFGSGAETVPYEAFKNCTSLELLTLSDTLREISENAFEGCSALTRIVACGSLERVGDSAFVDCDAIKAVFYYGSAQEFDSIEISDGNSGNASFAQAKLYIYSEGEPTESGDQEYWYYDNNGKIRVW